MATASIGKPAQRDGVWIVTVTRPDGSKEDCRFPSKQAAESGEQALRRAAALLLPRSAADPGSVRGPYFDKSDSRWKLRWREGGESRSFTNAEKAPVQAKRVELVGESDKKKPYLKKLTEKNFDGTATAYEKANKEAALALNAATVAGDDEWIMRLRRYSSGLSELAGSVAAHSKYVKMQREFIALLEYVESVQCGRGDRAAQPPAARSINRTLAGRTGPTPKVH